MTQRECTHIGLMFVSGYLNYLYNFERKRGAIKIYLSIINQLGVKLFPHLRIIASIGSRGLREAVNLSPPSLLK